jgi:hypothetical protein
MPAKVEHWANHREPAAQVEKGIAARRIAGSGRSPYRYACGDVDIPEPAAASAAAPGATAAHDERTEVRGCCETADMIPYSPIGDGIITFALIAFLFAMFTESGRAIIGGIVGIALFCGMFVGTISLIVQIVKWSW